MYRNLTLLLACCCFFATPALAAEPAQPFGAPLLSAPPRGVPGPPASAAADEAAYERCMAEAKRDPAAARKTAENWKQHGGAHPAEHCLDVALIGLKEYREAAARLEKLAGEMIQAPATLRAEVLDQAAQAWLLAGDPGRAYAADGAALALRPGEPDLLVDRAEAAGAARWFDKAVADLDHVLKANPARLDALIYRAAAYRALDRLDPALADVENALKLAPDSVPALLERGNIRVLRGELDGARHDWARAAQLAPGSAAEAAARANIAKLDAAQKAAAKEPEKH